MSNYTSQANTTRSKNYMYVNTFETETQWINSILADILLYMREKNIDTSLADYLSLIFNRDIAYKMINGLYLENHEIDIIIDWFLIDYWEEYNID